MGRGGRVNVTCWKEWMWLKAVTLEHHGALLTSPSLLLRLRKRPAYTTYFASLLPPKTEVEKLMCRPPSSCSTSKQHASNLMSRAADLLPQEMIKMIYVSLDLRLFFPYQKSQRPQHILCFCEKSDTQGLMLLLYLLLSRYTKKREGLASHAVWFCPSVSKLTSLTDMFFSGNPKVAKDRSMCSLCRPEN